MNDLRTNKPFEWKEGTGEITARWDNKDVVIACVVIPEWHENKTCGSREAAANAAFIVRACNSHDDMLRDLKQLRDIVDAVIGGPNSHIGPLIERADSTIAKAEGRTS